MIEDHYLHVQRWKPNLIPESAKITTHPIWVHFLVLLVEHYSESWLRRAEDKIGRTIKVDDMTLYESRGKFAHICIEVDLTKPLKAGYRTREKSRR